MRSRTSRDCLGLLVGLLGLAALAGLASCTHTVKVEPIKFEPIDITLHIYLEEADKKLDSFFSDVAAATPATAEPVEGGGS